MPRITKVYTRTGDDGSTALGGGQRNPKDSLRIESFGTVDELNACIGLALASGVDVNLREPLKDIQNTLFHLGADLCLLEEDKEKRAAPGVEKRHVDTLEFLMDRLSQGLAPLENFILPGGQPGAAALHVARTVARRAERLVVSLARSEAVGPFVVCYLNRLSDALFVMARYDNHRKGTADTCWKSHI